MSNQGHNFTKDEQRKGGQHFNQDGKKTQFGSASQSGDKRKENSGHQFSKEEQSRGGKNS